MANIHTFSDFNKNNNSKNSNNNTASYAPLGFSFGGAGNDGQPFNWREAFFPGFGYKTFVFIITMVQIAFFLITEILSFILFDSEERDNGFSCVLYQFGGKYTPAIVALYHIHRLFMPIFLHAGVAHIFFNMLSQWIYGFRLEDFYSVKKFALLYFVSGIGGNLLSSIFNKDNISVGASSALFGLFALQVVYFIENYDNLGPRKQFLIIFLIFLILANFGTAKQTEKEDTSAPGVDNSAHLGGFIVGALIAVLYMKRPSDEKFYKKQRIAAGLLAAFFIICSCILATVMTDKMEQQAKGFNKSCGHAFFGN